MCYKLIISSLSRARFHFSLLSFVGLVTCYHVIICLLHIPPERILFGLSLGFETLYRKVCMYVDYVCMYVSDWESYVSLLF